MVNSVVEKQWKSLRETLRTSVWKDCGEKSQAWWKNKLYTKKLNILHIISGNVESFTMSFARVFTSAKWVVLHIFHIAYYYDY